MIDRDVDAAYTAVETVDPFRYAACRDALLSDAEAALAGDEESRERALQRLREIFGK